MAENGQRMNRESNEPSGHANKESNGSRRPAARVNFDDMNYEQRRAPYNSGERMLSEKEYDEKRREKGANRRQNDR